MASFRNSGLQQGYLLLLVLAFTTLVSAIEVNVCASFNTAQTPLTWQPEDCGGPGLFGYILLNEVAPSGTSTAPASSTTAQTNVVIVTNSVTKTGAEHNVNNVLNNVQLHNCFHHRVHFHLGVFLHLLFHIRDVDYFSDSTSSSSSSSASTTPPPSSASSGGQSSGGSSSGLPQQTADPTGDQSGTTSKKSKSGISSGAIAGIVVGVVGGLALIAAALFFWLRRRRQNQDEYRDDPSVRGSSSGMVGSVPPEMSVNGGSPASPVTAANRNSTIQIDPRMDPFKQGLYIRGSQESLNTLRDDHDYSRRIQRPPVLRATNPDPEEA
ncbi:hypothetical protein ACHAPV_002436 [Trichoderma viride]